MAKRNATKSEMETMDPEGQMTTTHPDRIIIRLNGRICTAPPSMPWELARKLVVPLLLKKVRRSGKSKGGDHGNEN